MADFLLLIPTGPNVGLTTVAIGFVRAFEREGIRVGFAKPIAQPRLGGSGESERSTEIIRASTHLDTPEPVTREHAERAMREGNEQRLMEEVVARVRSIQENADVVVVEGLVPTEDMPFATQLNASLGRTLDADLIFVCAPADASPDTLVQSVQLTARSYPSDRIAGVVLNKVPEVLRPSATPTSMKFSSYPPPPVLASTSAYAGGLRTAGYVCIGSIPRRDLLGAPRVRDLARALAARVIRPGDLDRRVLTFRLAAITVPNCLSAMNPGTLVVTPGDRNDVIMATCLMMLRGVPVAGLWLSCGVEPDARVLDLCGRAFELGLPVLLVDEMTLEATSSLLHLDTELPVDDTERIELVMSTVADYLDREWIRTKWHRGRIQRLSPAAFRYRLIERAHAANRRIVLPEGAEPRTVQAAAICHERGIARCVLLGKPALIRRAAADQGVELPSEIEIIDPETVIGRYLAPLLERRKHKGLTEIEGINQLHDEVILGTLMLAVGDVDGLVSGAVHTTADTVRPALQLVKTAPGVRLVSSVFFMCLPDQVLVYGDCAINPHPSAADLADIALQSAASAESFGIEPRVALISYSTGTSGSGAEVAKVREATALARARRPDLLIDGPLQYDAAVMPDVAFAKAPGSPVAGRATVIVFPDLNTGNTTYKAVQRSAKVVSIGPMLQGLAKPVNDLSRGALVDDIVYTIALTAIQSVACR
jgi:phosphate acetyltransferase